MPHVDKYKGIHLEPLECAVKGLDPEDGSPMDGYTADALKSLHWPAGAPLANSQPQGQQHRDEILYRMALIDYYFSDNRDRSLQAFDDYAMKYVREKR
jgi:hypothetical protein